jgi:cell division protein FtsZ
VTNTSARQGGDPFDHHHQTGALEAPVAQGPAAAPATVSDDTAPSGTERPEGVRTEAPERAQAIKRGPEAVAPRRADGDPSPASPGWSLAKGIERGIRRAGVFGGGSKPVGMTRAAATAAEQASEVSSGQARKAAPLSPHDRPHVAATDQEASAYDEAGEDDDQRSGQGGGEPDLFGSDRSDDPLEIPAFLRRQAN